MALLHKAHWQEKLQQIIRLPLPDNFTCKVVVFLHTDWLCCPLVTLCLPLQAATAADICISSLSCQCNQWLPEPLVKQ